MTDASPVQGPERALLLVAGSGRSGTSLFAGLTGRLGLHIPQPEVLADTSNPNGFGEPRWAVDFHEELLKTLDVTREDARPVAWEAAAKVLDRPAARQQLRDWLAEQLDQASRVVVKDPRLSWFLGLYGQVAEELGAEVSIVTLLRHPAASIKSRELAYGTGSTPATRTAGWLNMMLFTEARTRGLRRAFVHYDELLADWAAAFRTVEGQLGLPMTSCATQEQLAAANALVDPGLQRAEPDWTQLQLPDELQSLGESAYAALQPLASGAPDDEGALARLDEVRDRYVAYYANAESVARSSIAAARAKERRRVAKHLQQDGPSSGVARRLAGRLRALTSATDRAPADGAR